MHLFNIGFVSFTFVDLADILLFTAMFYKLFTMLKDSRATTMFLGLFTVVLIGIIADFLNLSIMSWLLSSITTIFWLAFFILFQPELRRLLTQIGQNRIIRKILKIKSNTMTDEITNAAFALSEKRMGGLIVLQKNVGLKYVIETGVPIKSEVSADLIVTMFNPGSPLHDGAVIIINDMISAARCILPITSRDIDSSFGTRHRAAIGLSDESDAVIVVISEETGKVRIAYNGRFLNVEDKNSLRNKISRFFKNI